jgi:ribose transport system ATP-binding protein
MSKDIPAVAMEHITKHFGNNVVLKDVSFDVLPGEVHALLGGNGAGKSTLMKILMGVYRADRGKILIAGKSIKDGSIGDQKEHGIAMIFQELSLLPNLSVADNIWLGHEPLRPGWRVDRPAIREKAAALLKHHGFSIPADAAVADLPFAQRQIVEIVKAVSHGARILIMDEPTSSLTMYEEEKLFTLIEELKRRSIAIVYISHRLAEIFRISDRITILKDGRTIGPLVTSKTDLKSTTAMLSTPDALADEREVHDSPQKIRAAALPVLAVQSLGTARKLKNISFTIKPGEVVGLAGLVGSGRSTLAKSLVGLLKDVHGEIQIDGKPVPSRSPWAAYKAGMGFVPEDRHLEGLVDSHTLAENISLPNLGRMTLGGGLGIVLKHKTISLFQKWQQSLSIDAKSASQSAAELSGGNQQKVVFAKWLAGDLRILILDEPTAGVDVGAKKDMRKAIRKVTATGVGVLLINSELDELIALSDRALIIAGGRITRQWDKMSDEGELRATIQSDAAREKTRTSETGDYEIHA